MKNDPLKISGMHHGTSPRVFKNAKLLRDNMTEPEKRLWDYLKTKPKGYKFRRQHPIAGYVLDFYCHKLRMSIEIDGGYHLKIEQKQKDTERTNYLKQIGITELRFTNEDVLTQYSTVEKHINNKLSADIPLGIKGECKDKKLNYD